MLNRLVFRINLPWSGDWRSAPEFGICSGRNTISDSSNMTPEILSIETKVYIIYIIE